MVLVINLIAALILFWYPIKIYTKGEGKIVPHPFDGESNILLNVNLQFLTYSILTAMVFLGPLSLVKYGYWVGAFILLIFTKKLTFKVDAIVGAYLLFVGWGVISELFYSSAKFEGLMMLIKYTLPLLYLWLAYTSINDSDDLMYFLKRVAIGMCIYALIIGGFSAKFLPLIYGFLNFQSGGVVISYASLADYFSALVVIPIALYTITGSKKWLWATLWVILSTILETVRTGLGGIFLASSFFLLTIFRGRAIPWIAGLCIAAVAVVFTVPSFRDKMFGGDDTKAANFTAKDANFETISSNGREYLWDVNMRKFYYGHEMTGSGLGSLSKSLQEGTGLKLVHSDYVNMLCDIGLIGIGLFGLFIVVTLLKIMHIAWSRRAPDVLRLTGGMALGSCGGTFFSMAFDNVVAYSQQSFVLPFVMIGIFLKAKDLYEQGEWA